MCAIGVQAALYFRLKVRRVDYYTFLGQAYVDGIMDYKGDLNQDISDGKVNPKEFWVI